MIGKLVVFSVGLAAGIIGKAIYDGQKAAGASFSETLPALLEGLENGGDKFREGFKEGFERRAL